MFCIYYYGQEQRKKFASKIEIDSTVSSFDDTLRPPQCDKITAAKERKNQESKQQFGGFLK